MLATFSFQVAASAHNWSQLSVLKLDQASLHYAQDLKNLKLSSADKAKVLTLWGGMKRYLKAKNLNGQTELWEHELLEKPLKVYGYAQVMPTGKQARDLVVFFPGMFGGYKGKVTPFLINIFEKAKTHVLVIPNFLSKEYLKARARYSDDNVTSLDGRIAADFIKRFTRRLGADELARVHLVAESLGAHVAAQAFEMLRSEKTAPLPQTMTLLWPSLDLKYSLKVFDDKFVESEKDFQRCSYLGNLPALFTELVWKEFPSALGKKQASCLSSFLFHTGLLSAIENAHEIVQPKIELIGPRYFSAFIRDYNPHLYSLLEDDWPGLKLNYWLKKWKDASIDIRIVTSVDDFINRKKDIDTLSLTPLVLEWGEHSAPLALDIWNEILVRELSLVGI